MPQRTRKTAWILCKKLFQFLLALFLLSLDVFYIARLAPGDPLRSYYGESVERMSPQERESAIHSLGLDQPIHTQYKIWLSNAFHGNRRHRFVISKHIAFGRAGVCVYLWPGAFARHLLRPA